MIGATENLLLFFMYDNINVMNWKLFLLKRMEMKKILGVVTI